jgi:hypothetical protein
MSNPTEPPAWLDENIENRAKVLLGHEAVMLDRVQRVQRIGEVVARNAMTGKYDDVTGWPGVEEGETMGVNIGDVVNHYYPQPAESTNGSAAEPSRPDPPTADPDAEKRADELTDRKLGPKAKLAAGLAAAILGGAAIPGVGIPLASWFGVFDPPPVEQIIDTDTVRSLEIGKRLPTAEELQR